MTEEVRTCRHGHLLADDTTYLVERRGYTYRRCAACQRARSLRDYDTRHAGHNVVITAGQTKDGHPRRRCLTCSGKPSAYMPPEADAMAVQRAIQGDPPPRLNVSERREAILQLHGELSGRLIAERIGISPRTVWRHLAAVRPGAAA